MSKTNALNGMLLAMLSGSLALTACSGGAPREVGSSQDAVEGNSKKAFEDAMSDLKHESKMDALIDTLQERRIVFAAGFYNIAADLGQGQTDQAELYFADQMKWLDDNDICWSIAAGSVVAAPEENAKGVADEILRPDFNAFKKFANFAKGNARMTGEQLWGCKDKDAIVVSHSRGGIDVLAALYADPALTKPGSKLAGWVSIQSPFFGSQLASDLVKKKITREQVVELATFLENVKQTKKTGESLKDQAPNIDLVNDMLGAISVETREPYMALHTKELAALLDSGLPIISVGTKSDSKVLPELLQKPRNYLLDTYKADNDGLLLQGAANLRIVDDAAHGSSYVEYGGDHLSTVFNLSEKVAGGTFGKVLGKILDFNADRPSRLRSFQALLSMTLQKADARK